MAKETLAPNKGNCRRQRFTAPFCFALLRQSGLRASSFSHSMFRGNAVAIFHFNLARRRPLSLYFKSERANHFLPLPLRPGEIISISPFYLKSERANRLSSLSSTTPSGPRARGGETPLDEIGRTLVGPHIGLRTCGILRPPQPRRIPRTTSKAR